MEACAISVMLKMTRRSKNYFPCGFQPSVAAQTACCPIAVKVKNDDRSNFSGAPAAAAASVSSVSNEPFSMSWRGAQVLWKQLPLLKAIRAGSQVASAAARRRKAQELERRSLRRVCRRLDFRCCDRPAISFPPSCPFGFNTILTSRLASAKKENPKVDFSFLPHVEICPQTRC